MTKTPKQNTIDIMANDSSQNTDNLSDIKEKRADEFTEKLQSIAGASKEKRITLAPGTVLEFERESIYKERWIGTIIGYYFANDAAEDSMDPYDHLLEVRENKTGKRRTIHPDKIVRLIRNAVSIKKLKKGNILEIKKLNEEKSFLATVLDLTSDSSGSSCVRVKINKSDKIEIIKREEIVKVIG